MKKTLFVAAAVALLPFVACQKETLIPQNSAEEIEEIHASPVFTAVIGNAGTKTTVSMMGKVNWEGTDSITVKDAAGASAVYKVSKINSDGSAEFLIREGETLLGEGPYSATYGTEPSKEQIWKKPDMTGGLPIFPLQLYMEADQTDDYSFTFDVKCSVITFGLLDQNDDDLIKSVRIIYTPKDSATEEVYTLDCEEPQFVADDNTWFGSIVVPAGTLHKIVFTNSKGLVHMQYNYSGEIDDKKQAQITMNNMFPIFYGRMPYYLLPSEFSVGEDARVMFAAGNHYNNQLWEENQYDIASTEEYDPNHVGLFLWCKSIDNACGPSYYESDEGFFAGGPDNNGTSVSYGENTSASSRNFALSKEQWEYLLNLDGEESWRQGKRFAKARVKGVNGLLVFPDDYDGVTSGSGFSDLNDKSAGFPGSNISEENWASLLADGVLFLPVAGRRWYDSEGGTVAFDSEAAQYWTSSSEDNKNTAYYLDFGDSDIKFVSGSSDVGRAVRLAKPANAYFWHHDD